MVSHSTIAFNSRMAVAQIELDAVKQFLQETSRGILITRRRDGGVQSSPMTIVADDAGDLLLSTRQTAAKVTNLKRDPYAAVTAITEQFLGPWMHLDCTAEITFLPDALSGLADFYRRRFAEDTGSEAFKDRMIEEGRCLIRLRVDRVVQPPPRPPRAATAA
jgi:PPOX class probable F420-dependent enzyme